MSNRKKQETFNEQLENMQDEVFNKANKKFKGKLIGIAFAISIISGAIGGASAIKENVTSLISSGDEVSTSDKINITLTETSKTNASTISTLIEENAEKDKEISDLKKQVEELKNQLETKKQ